MTETQMEVTQIVIIFSAILGAMAYTLAFFIQELKREDS